MLYQCIPSGRSDAFIPLDSFRGGYKITGLQCLHWSVNGLLVALRLTPVAHSALFLSGHKATLFDRRWAGSASE